MRTENNKLRLALPKGRMQQHLYKLLEDARVCIDLDARAYRPRVSGDLDIKLLKPQNIVHMLANGSRDLGFSGADWVQEIGVSLIELIDTKLDPVNMVVAAPQGFNLATWPKAKPLVIASEYIRIAELWAKQQSLDTRLVRSFGATEVYPPDDADCIIDITQTGSTLKSNCLTIVEPVLESSTRLYANEKSLEDPQKRRQIEDFVMLIRSVLDARERVMLEMNISESLLANLVEVLPSMRQPTVSKLFGTNDVAVKAAVPRSALPSLIALLKARGASDLVVSAFTQIVP